MRRIAILFLAHRGIAVPEIWRQWRKEFIKKGRRRILFFALMNCKEPGWTSIPLRPTAWGDVSLVYAYQDGLRYIMKYDKKQQIQSVFFVSGQDIPIRSAKFVYRLPDQTRIWSADYSVYHMAQWHSLNRKVLKHLVAFEFHELEKKLRSGVMTTSTVVKHIESCQEYIELFRFDLERRKAAGTEDVPYVYRNIEALKIYKRLLKSKKLQLHRSCPEAQDPLFEYKYGNVPDEFFIKFALHQLIEEGKLVQEDILESRIMGQERLKLWNVTMPSPTEWHDWNYEVDCSGHRYNLERMIQKSLAQGALFFRKVSPKLPFRRPWKM
jgi:hypothetical protein